MAARDAPSDLLDEGTLTFSIESRVLRELGERLVKEPDVALLELVKNSYDADATTCDIAFEADRHILVADDGHGMTLDAFKRGWMRIGTSAKESSALSPRFERAITGEKGIGRFAVRYLGSALQLESVADDPSRGTRTLLFAEFDWPKFDRDEDLGRVNVPYRLTRVRNNTPTGTRLTISSLRPTVGRLNLYAVRTASISVVSPYQALLQNADFFRDSSRKQHRSDQDPGFNLRVQAASSDSEDEGDGDLARSIVDNFVLRAVVNLKGDKLRLEVYRRGQDEPVMQIADRYPNRIGRLHADIRFFPKRKGAFTGMPVDGRRTKKWVSKHAGVAVFDRTFRVHPYGLQHDDWLVLSADTARRQRDPRSSIARTHFPMDAATRSSTQLNYMLRLPYPEQLIGVVQVQGQRVHDARRGEQVGLVAAADREGFVHNAAFQDLFDIVRGAVEAIACADRELQLDTERAEHDEILKRLREETRSAVREIESNPNIALDEKTRIVKRLLQTQELAEQAEESSQVRESALEVMSLLGIVAGFMTHEFGAALLELETALSAVQKLARRDSSFKNVATAIQGNIAHLKEFVLYSQGYIQGTSTRAEKPYGAKPRLQRTVRVFGKYAQDRDIKIKVQVEADVIAPPVPVSLYDGVALNLYTNALKAITAKEGNGERCIALRAWNKADTHFLEVSDTGIGIPSSLRHRVFDPLFTTTGSNRDPLGSGMGLGLSLVKRSVESFGGRVAVVDPPAGFTTCVQVRLPLPE